jgi:hypothetical protein
VIGPNTLSSPALSVQVSVMVASPPQQASGNAVPGLVPSAGNVAWKRSGLMMVMFLSGIKSSGTPSPLVSQLMATDVGMNPQLTKFNVIAQSPLIMPTVDRAGTAG